MSLKEQIQKDLLGAMKAGDAVKKDALRMLKAAIMKWEVSGEKKEAKDEDIIPILKKEIKQRQDAAEQFEKGNRPEQAEKEKAEQKILKAYLPEQMPEEEVEKIVKETIEQTGASGPQDFGKVMGAVMGKIKDQADGNVVNQLVKKLLG